MKYRTLKRTLAGLLLSVSLVGGAFAQAEDLHLKGNWESLSGDFIRGTWEASLVRSAGELSGAFRLTGSNVLLEGQISGTVDSSSIVIGVTADGVRQASFAGRLDGDSVSGEWEFIELEDRGVWYGQIVRASRGDDE